jgi:hypothetical protein
VFKGSSVHRLSRRHFLQLLGVTLGGSGLSALELPQIIPSFNADAAIGRTFSVASLYRAPHPDAPVVKRLWADSVVSLLDRKGRWYRVPGGYLRHADVQPMIPYQPPSPIATPTMPFWAEVAAPVAVLRRWCSAEAPLVARIGHGGILQVVDALQNSGGVWYSTADEHGLALGWSQALHWRPVETVTAPAAVTTLQIESESQQLTALQGEKLVLQAPLSTGVALQPGLYEIVECERSTTQQVESTIHYGAPSVIRFGNGYEIAGVYWHNRFGAPVPGAAIQVSPLAAKWLYHLTGKGSKIIVSG